MSQENIAIVVVVALVALVVISKLMPKQMLSKKEHSDVLGAKQLPCTMIELSRPGAVVKQDFSAILAIRNGFDLSRPRSENPSAVTARLAKVQVALA